MIRRARIAFISAAVLFVLIGFIAGGAITILQTAFGREQVRRLVVSLLRTRMRGSLYVGRITDGFLTGVTIDSLAIRDTDDSLFVSSGPVTIHYDVRDLLDRRIILRGVRAEHPLVYIRQHENGDWNFRTIWTPTKRGPIQTKRGFGDYVVIDSAVIRNATFLLTLPWHPSRTLRRAARDSTIRFELARKDHEVRRTKEGFARTWRWSGGNATLVHGRVSHPDSAGMLFVVRDVSVNESDPPFLFRNASGTMRQLGDSIWMEVPHWDLPGSTGSGRAKIWWGNDLPVRYAIHVNGDSVSMRDVVWVYPTLPTTGGGRTTLDIRTEPRNVRLTDYALTGLDVRSTRSHLTGRMTFTTGEDTLIVKDVQLAASPVNFDLLRTLNGKPFPYNWQGDITGTVRASGGNLGRFKVEDARFTFADANVPGAVSRGSAHGEVNIFQPAFTAFHDLTVNAETFDLRTPQYLNKEFPRLKGTISGTAVLDSSWLDVRFHDADITHHDEPGPVSRVTGSGRVTWGETYLTYDLDLQAQPVSFTTIRRSYPLFPLHGEFAGPVRVRGESPDLQLTTSLVGAGGTLAYDGRVDMDPPVYGARGTGSVANADLRVLLGRPELPQTVVNGAYAVDLSGDTLPRVTGLVMVALTPSTLGGTRVDSSLARVHFDNGMLHVDTLAVHTSAGGAEASGTVALDESRSGSLAYAVTVASLEEANRLFGHPLTAPVAGSGTVTGTLSGTPSLLSVTGDVRTRDLAYKTVRVQRARAQVAFRDVTHTPTGAATVHADSIAGGPVAVDSLGAELQVSDPRHAAFSAHFAGRGALRGTAAGRVAVYSEVAPAASLFPPPPVSRADIQVDSARLVVDSANGYQLMAPVHVVADTHAVAFDSLLFTRTGGGVVAVRDVRFTGDSIRGALKTSGFTLALLELFTTAATNLQGALTADVRVDGPVGHPHIGGAITVDGGAATLPQAGARLDHITADIAVEGDTVRVRRLSAETLKERRGSVNVSGTVAVGQYDNPVFALQATAQNLRTVDKRGVASLDISTVTPVTLTGPYRGAVVRGGIRVDRGAIYIPELIRKRLVDLSSPELSDLVDTTKVQNRSLLPAAPSEFMKNLRVEDVAIHIGDDVWLRSAEANIKLGGALSVTMGKGGNTPQLALEGELNAVRGTYRLDIVPLVQPVFDVESGTIRFYGTPDLDAALNITAINTVRKPQQSINRQDVRIRATIGGTLTAPTLTLSSADNLPLTQSDLLSYLITGEPAFALDYTTQQYVNQLAAVAIRSAGSVISSAIPRSVFDVFELQTPGALNEADLQTRIDNPTLYNLSNLLNTRAVFGKQLNGNLFLNFSTGFCAANFRNNLGLRLEYRFKRIYTVLLGLEPGSSDLVCARSGASSSFQQTPPQVGGDLFRAWRF